MLEMCHDVSVLKATVEGVPGDCEHQGFSRHLADVSLLGKRIAADCCHLPFVMPPEVHLLDELTHLDVLLVATIPQQDGLVLPVGALLRLLAKLLEKLSVRLLYFHKLQIRA